MIFADSSFLIAFAVDDQHSAEAVHWTERHPAPLVVSDLVLFETFNTLRSLRVRGGLSKDEEKGGRLMLSRLEFRGGLIRRSLRMKLLVAEAHRLIDHFSPERPERPHGAMDVLHVAAARLLRVGHFASFDDNQRALAGAAGLQVVP